MTPIRMILAAIIMPSMLLHIAHGAPNWLSNLRQMTSKSPPSTTSSAEDFSFDDEVFPKALSPETNTNGLSSNPNLPKFLHRAPELAMGAISGWFLMSFVKELRMLLKELGSSGLTNSVQPKLDPAKGNWLAPASAEIEALIARMTPVYQQLYSPDQKKLEAASKAAASAMNASPPTLAQKTQAAFRMVLSSLTAQELQMLSSILPSVPKQPPNVGGHEKLKRTLLSALTPKRLGTQSYHRSDLLTQPSGVLLYGPSGTGKTHISNWARWECWQRGVPFLCVGPGSFYSKFVGETSQRVKTFFTLCSKLNTFNEVYQSLFSEQTPHQGYRKCVIFVDEVDGLFRDRNGGQGGEGSEVYRDFKTEFMQMWDGVEEGGIVVIGASNRPYDIDEAFQRRMPRSFLIGLPNYGHRLKILESITAGIPCHAHALRPLAKRTDGFSASDLKEVTRIAAHRWVEGGERRGGIGVTDFEAAVEGYQPTGKNARGFKNNEIRAWEEREGCVGGGGGVGGEEEGEGDGGFVSGVTNAFNSVFGGGEDRRGNFEGWDSGHDEEEVGKEEDDNDNEEEDDDSEEDSEEDLDLEEDDSDDSIDNF
ncbi:hypothetical protein TrLO_g5850 [Triparma laevis f. longispina]|uniref:AAA+ ATPase domain-containing protein n=1 Tax=Triparma laevis f. longispina TaxID=1714387 RepID=A0A9W6ZGK8_9STRA|nr:hypothetical protein TrLO_g5850 [Triparma laevis f. longispina]